jgi:hypothetical protein
MKQKPDEMDFMLRTVKLLQHKRKQSWGILTLTVAGVTRTRQGTSAGLGFKQAMPTCQGHGCTVPEAHKKKRPAIKRGAGNSATSEERGEEEGRKTAGAPNPKPEQQRNQRVTERAVDR